MPPPLTATPTIDLEKLRSGKQTGPLPDDVQEQIAAVALHEIQEEEKGGEKPPAPTPEKLVVEETDEAKAAKEKEEADNKAREEAEEKANQDRLEKEAKDADDAVIAAIMAKPDEELSDEEKKRKAELLEKNPELAFQEEVKAYAKSENIPAEEAKEILESERKIVEQHKGDPKKLARSYRSAQSAYSRLETKIRQEQERAASVLKDNEVVIAGKKMTFDEARDQMIPAFRNRFAGKAFKVGDKEIAIAELDDEKVFELAKTDYQQRMKAHTEKIHEKIQSEAKKKRDEIVSKLPQYATPFKNEFVELLGFIKDGTILEEDFDPDYVLNSARGAFYTPEKLKEIEAMAFKRGQENAKILGLKGGPQGGTPPAKEKLKDNSPEGELASLTQEHKNRALEMFQGATFDSAGWDDARKFREYIDHLKGVGEWPIKKT